MKRILSAVAGVLAAGALGISGGIAAASPPTLPSLEAYPGNWAGYVDIADSGKTFTYVGATFTIPKLDAAQKIQCVAGARKAKAGDSYASYWVGLDGNTDRTVEQVGVETYCTADGYTGAFALYEMYPRNAVESTIETNPGDKIVVDVTYLDDDKYGLYLHDVTNGQFFDVVEACPSTCNRNSAEVITEDPGGDPPDYVLADYGSVNYSGVSVKGSDVTGTLKGSSAWSGNNKIDEGSGGVTMQTTSDLNSAGTAFSDTFDHQS
jgi:Peptidase A4 family